MRPSPSIYSAAAAIFLVTSVTANTASVPVSANYFGGKNRKSILNNDIRRIPRGGASSPSSTRVTSAQLAHRPNDGLQVSGGNTKTGGGTATVSNEIFNLVKSIVGAGVLSLPAGT